MLKGHTTENTLVVADFDRTITTGEPGCASAFGVFPRSEGASPEIQKRARELFNFYYPIETDPNISDDERSKHMRQWNEKVQQLLGEYIDTDQLERVLEFARKNIKIRGGKKEALQELGVKGIPLIVFSAGVTNVIETVLREHDIPFRAIHSNTLGFRRGILELIGDGVYIGHKGWESLPINIKKSVEDRTHTLLLGDSLDDMNMADVKRITTSVGYLNSEQKSRGRKDTYIQTFDHVVESDYHDNGIMKRLLTAL